MTKEETDVAIQTYVEGIKMYLPSIVMITMIGSVMYFISIVLMMIGSYQKIRELMIPYIILQCYLGINLFVCSIVLSLTIVILRYSELELILAFGSLLCIVFFDLWLLHKASPYLAYFCSVAICILYLATSDDDIVVRLSFLTTFYLPMPFLCCLLKAQNTYELLGRTTDVSNIKQDEKET